MQLEPQEISVDVFQEKYAKNNEKTIPENQKRVAIALAAMEKDSVYWEPIFFKTQEDGFVAGGRINSAAGMNSESTLINCFIQPIGDSISGVDDDGYPSIYDAIKQAAETMRRGGGVGYDFSRIRPKDAYVKGTQSRASGPISYIRVFDRSCETVESAGGRRGAQMSVLRCDHPDIFKFVIAKSTKGEFNNFNLSIGVTDDFMKAVKEKENWKLVHKARPCDEYIKLNNSYKDETTGLWVWKIIPVEDLWNLIMKSTYDFAEPGILFLNRMNQENNLYYCETIEATNPCVTGDTLILTYNGYERIDTLVGTETQIWNGFEWSTVIPKITGTDQEIFDMEFSNGTKLSCTPYHKFILSDNTRIEAKDLTIDHKLSKFTLPILEGYINTDNKIAYTQGFYSGDGNTNRPCIFLYNEKSKLINKLAISNSHDRSFNTTTKINVNLSFNPEAKNFVPDNKYTIKTRLSWLAGIIDSNGTVSDKTVNIWSIDNEFLNNIKLMLTTLGCSSSLLLGKEEGYNELPDGKGGTNEYKTQTSYILTIPGSSIFLLKALGLKTKRVNIDSSVTRDANKFITLKNKTLREKLESKVYCFTDELNNSGVFNGIMTANCGEQPLPPYGCCDLGSINLTKFIKNPFSLEASFDEEKFVEVVKVSIRMLDNVLDATAWPLEQQRQEAMNKRRIGLGFLGLGDAIIMLGKYYNKQDGVEFAKYVSRLMRDTAYIQSVELAKEKGAFPFFDKEKYLAGNFISRLPRSIIDMIDEYGIRNSHLLSIAPTGTISLAFADNASNGIEPPFSWVYNRKKRMNDGSYKIFEVTDHAWRLYRSMGKDMENLPPNFVTALEMTVAAHKDIMEAVQPFIDTAISKTVNIPADYPYDDFKNLYIQAWEAGLKGLATYRPNDTLGAILSVKKEETTVASVVDKVTIDSDNGKTLDELIDEMYSQTFESREDGSLPGVSIKGRFHTNNGEQKFIITINFMTIVRHTRFGILSIRRPVEFILTSNFTDSSSIWGASMRFLSLMARSGVSISKAIENLREITWEHGNVKYGTKIKDGKKIPLWHSSDCACIGFIIQENLIKEGYLDQNGNLTYNYHIDNNNKIVENNTKILLIDNNEQVNNIAPTGRKCPECGAMNVIKLDGCEKCEACGWLGACS